MLVAHSTQPSPFTAVPALPSRKPANSCLQTSKGEYSPVLLERSHPPLSHPAVLPCTPTPARLSPPPLRVSSVRTFPLLAALSRPPAPSVTLSLRRSSVLVVGGLPDQSQWRRVGARSRREAIEVGGGVPVMKCAPSPSIRRLFDDEKGEKLSADVVLGVCVC